MLKNIAFLLINIFFLGSSTFASNNFNEDDILNQKQLRIVVNYGPRYGNQSACFNLMNDLLEAGFKGEFHVVYDDTGNISDPIEKKIKHFLPTYIENGPLTQRIGNILVEKLVPQGEDENGDPTYPLKHNPVAMTGCNDSLYNSSCLSFNCDFFINLKPLYWRGNNDIHTRDGNYIKGNANIRRWVNLSSNKQLDIEEIEHEEKETVSILLKLQKNQEIYFHSVYGRIATENERFLLLKKLIAAEMFVKDVFHKDFLILSNDNIADSIQQSLINEFSPEHFKIISSREEFIKRARDHNLLDSSHKRITLINMGMMGSNAIKFLQTVSTLPSVVEGANSCEELENRAYLHWASPTPAFEQNGIITNIVAKAFKIESLNEIYNKANKVLASGDGNDIEPLKEFFSLYLKGEMKDYFIQRYDWYLNTKEDYITFANRMIREARR